MTSLWSLQDKFSFVILIFSSATVYLILPTSPQLDVSLIILTVLNEFLRLSIKVRLIKCSSEKRAQSDTGIVEEDLSQRISSYGYGAKKPRALEELETQKTKAPVQVRSLDR